MTDIKHITSLANPVVKEIAGLMDKKGRAAAGVFLLEGADFVRQGLAQGWELVTLVVRDEAQADGLKGENTRAMAVSREVMEKITRKSNPQAVCGVFRQRWNDVADAGKNGLWLGLDRVRDPGNLGTIIRTADAAGMAGIVLIGDCCDVFAPETVRASMGSIFRMPLARADEPGFLKAVKAGGVALAGTHVHARTVDYREADYPANGVLLMGNESAGLSDGLAAGCGVLVRIPMREGVESLNLAMASGLVMYRACGL